jgi:hypothetical protein
MKERLNDEADQYAQQYDKLQSAINGYEQSKGGRRI